MHSINSSTELLAVVNNAGILATGEVEFGKTLEPFEKQLDVNCLGTIRVTKTFGPLLRRCRTLPRLVNVTSLAARISLPGKHYQCLFFSRSKLRSSFSSLSLSSSLSALLTRQVLQSNKPIEGRHKFTM